MFRQLGHLTLWGSMRAGHDYALGGGPHLAVVPGMGPRVTQTLFRFTPPGPTHSGCSNSGLGTHWRRRDSNWKALLWGSSMSSPYSALIRYGLFFTSSSCRRRSRAGRGGGQGSGP